MIPVLGFLKEKILKDWRLAVVTGEEEFLRDEAIEHLDKGLAKSVERVRMDASEGLELRDLLDELRSRSLFGEDRLIHLKNAEAFVKEHAKPLIAFLEGGEMVQRFLIEGAKLVAKGKKGKATGVVLAVQKLEGPIVRCDPLYDTTFGGRGAVYDNPLARWVQGRAKRHKIKLRLETAHALHRLVGNRLRELDAELEKLALHAKGREEVTDQDLQSCVAAGRLMPLYDLADAVCVRAAGKVFQLSELLFERGVEDLSGRFVQDGTEIAIMINAALGSRLRLVAKASEAMAAGMGFPEAAKLVRQPPAFMDRLRAQVQAWRNQEELDRVRRLLAQLEGDLKSGGGNPRVLVDRFLVEALAPPISGSLKRAFA